jgi:uncharacterized NAD(P)/FAD-binding protein YdhS
LLNAPTHVEARRIHAISRRGLLPLQQSENRRLHIHDALAESDGLSLRRLTRLVRERAREAHARGGDWRDVVNTVRASAPQLWSNLSQSDKDRFVRHLRPFWDIHRHRLPPHIWQALADTRAKNIFHPCAGRILAMCASGEQIEIQWQARGAGRVNTLIADAVINATGPNYALHATGNPLLRNLYRKGVISADAASLGIRTDSTGAVIGADDRPHAHLYYLGPMLRATHWEATAVAELRAHAEQLAGTLVSKQKSRSAV